MSALHPPAVWLGAQVEVVVADIVVPVSAQPVRVPQVDNVLVFVVLVTVPDVETP